MYSNSFCLRRPSVNDGHRQDSAAGRSLNIPGESKDSKQRYSVPIRVELIPCETVTSRLRMCMVVIVPTFAEA